MGSEMEEDFIKIFPYKPWPSQLEFMAKLYQFIDERKIGIMESPTGTVSELMLTRRFFKHISTPR